MTDQQIWDFVSLICYILTLAVLAAKLIEMVDNGDL